MIRRPEKTDLKYKVQWDGSIILKVDVVGVFSYVWQYCRYGTADWQSFGRVDEPQVQSEAGAAYRLGDKYRCLMYSGIVVKKYSSVLTVSEKTAEKAMEEEQKSAYQREEDERREQQREERRRTQRFEEEEESRRQEYPVIPENLFYFEGCLDFKEAETRYRQLMMRHHPDKGGNVETAKIINEQYEAVKAIYRR